MQALGWIASACNPAGSNCKGIPSRSRLLKHTESQSLGLREFSTLLVLACTRKCPGILLMGDTERSGRRGLCDPTVWTRVTVSVTRFPALRVRPCLVHWHLVPATSPPLPCAVCPPRPTSPLRPIPPSPNVKSFGGIVTTGSPRKGISYGLGISQAGPPPGVEPRSLGSKARME